MMFPPSLSPARREEPRPRRDRARIVLRASSVAFGVLALAACETYRGRLYPAWAVPRTEGNAVCRAVPGATRTAVELVVRDLEGGEIPGVLAVFRSAGERSALERQTDRRGRADVELRPGRWTVDVGVAGFRKGRATLEVPADQACVVTFSLEVSPQ